MSDGASKPNTALGDAYAELAGGAAGLEDVEDLQADLGAALAAIAAGVPDVDRESVAAFGGT